MPSSDAGMCVNVMPSTWYVGLPRLLRSGSIASTSHAAPAPSPSTMRIAPRVAASANWFSYSMA